MPIIAPTVIAPPPSLLYPTASAWDAPNPPSFELCVTIPLMFGLVNIQIDAEIWDTSDATVPFVETIMAYLLPGGRGGVAGVTPGAKWDVTFEVRGSFPAGMGLYRGAATDMGHYLITAKRKEPVSPGSPVRILSYDQTSWGGAKYGVWFGVGPEAGWYWPRSQENAHFMAAKAPAPLDKMAKTFQVDVVGMPGRPQYKIRPQTSGLDFTKPASSKTAATVLQQPMVGSFRAPPPEMLPGYVTSGMIIGW